jgi:hypothetical protein
MAEPPKAGSYELIIPGDATGFYYMCEMFRDLSVKNLQLSTTLDSYMPTTIDVDVKSLKFGTDDEMTYHLSVNGLKDFSMGMYGLDVWYVRCGNGDFDFIFSKNYRCLDLYGALKGNVLFGIFLPGFEEYEYEGSTLMIHIHIGNPPILGDTNKDSRVDVKDLFSVVKAYTLCIGDSGYKLNLDIDFNGKIDVKDIFATAKNFGKTW